MTNEHEASHLTRGQWIFYGFLTFIGFLLFTEHRAHVLGILPYLILLACPLMHMFMHRGHGGHDHNNSRLYETKEGEQK